MGFGVYARRGIDVVMSVDDVDVGHWSLRRLRGLRGLGGLRPVVISRLSELDFEFVDLPIHLGLRVVGSESRAQDIRFQGGDGTLRVQSCQAPKPPWLPQPRQQLRPLGLHSSTVKES